MASLSVLALVILASGCSTIYAGKYAFEDGWREGTIVSVGSAGSIAEPQFSDCRKRMTAEQLSVSQFALVKFQHLRHPQRRVVPLAGGTPSLRNSDEVYMNVDDCTIALVKR
ncbi:MAG: hypothetical protein IPK34_02710 [Ramlibacter sp.]|nr:hypothetical protein [Ramlibacter sp.]